MKTPSIDKLTDEQRQAILDYQRGRLINHTVGAFMAVFVTVFSFVASLIVGVALFESESGALSAFAFIFILSAPAILILSWFRFARYLDDQVVRRFLRERNEHGRVNLCPFCRYNLHNSVSDTCPECGAEVILVDADAP